MYTQPQRMPMPMPMPPRANIPPQTSYHQNTPTPTINTTRRSSGNDVDSAMSSIKHKLGNLSSEELSVILEDETKQNKIIQDSEQVNMFLTEKESLMSSNKQLADENLRCEPKLQTAKTQLFESYHQLPQIQEENEKHKQQIEKLSSQFSPDTTLALLKTAAQQADEEAEGSVTKFLDGNLAIEDFVETFMKQKMTHHLRKTKADKLEHILRKDHPQYFSQF